MSEGGLEIHIIGRNPYAFALADILLFIIALVVLWFYANELSATFYGIFPVLVLSYSIIAALFAWFGGGLLASWGVLFAGSIPYYWSICSVGLTPRPSQGLSFHLFGCPIYYQGNPIPIISPLVGALLISITIGTLSYIVGNSLVEGVKLS